ncbi:Caleosin-domain-containing protein, partial [Lepidopterella palustris CBS 459.81]
VAASSQSPNGTVENDWAREHQHQTVLQQHISYFDPQQTGVITPLSTYSGLRLWGWSSLLSLLATLLVHLGLSWVTQPSILPDPLFRIHISRIHCAKHGSDTGSYDNEGRFRPQQFEDWFSKYDGDRKGGLSKLDLCKAWNGQRVAMDGFGWVTGGLKWLATYLLVWPDDGVLRKEDARRVMDGSLFQWKADQYAEKQRQGREAGADAGKEKQRDEAAIKSRKDSLNLD